MSLVIYDSMQRKKRYFEPLQSGKVGLYVCGITVYDYCHIGHARTMVAFDLIVRCFELLGYDVNYIRNITDVDDKILLRSEENNEPWQQLTERFIKTMHEDFSELGLRSPDLEPRATGAIPQCLNMIQTLLDKDYAYVATNGDVYFAVDRFPEYGALSRRSKDEMMVGERATTNDFKRDPCDFALWKATAEGVGWDAPWGRGRPGWHIECSAMSTHCLGASFDIHGGGPDLLFPHHENEIAQSQCATGQSYARYWMHSGPVRVNDDAGEAQKMSKSLGNFVTIREALAERPSEVLRYLLMASHYRSPIDFSPALLGNAHNALGRLYRTVREFEVEAQPLDPEEPWSGRIIECLEDDFNLPKALALIFERAREINRSDKVEECRHNTALLLGWAQALGLLREDPEVFLKSGIQNEENDIDEERIETFIQARAEAREARDFARADSIRQQLAAAGVELEDRHGKTTWRRSQNSTANAGQ